MLGFSFAYEYSILPDSMRAAFVAVLCASAVLVCWQRCRCGMCYVSDCAAGIAIAAAVCWLSSNFFKDELARQHFPRLGVCPPCAWAECYARYLLPDLCSVFDPLSNP